MAGAIQKMAPLLKARYRLRWMQHHVTYDNTWSDKNVKVLHKSRDVKFLCVLLDCLHIMAFKDADAKLAILNSQANKDLLNILHKASDEKLTWTCSRLIKGEVTRFLL